MSEIARQTKEAWWRITTAFSILRNGADAPLIDRYRMTIASDGLELEFRRRKIVRLVDRVESQEDRFVRALAVLKSRVGSQEERFVRVLTVLESDAADT